MTSDLLVERRGDDSLMDIGVNCSKCNQLDFLPFQCEYCKLIFCSNHRRLSDHQCPHLKQFENQHIRPKSPTQLNQETVASLFPNRAADRAKIDKLVSQGPKPSNILETSFRVGDVKAKTAFKKFSKFLNLQQKKKSQNQAKITSFFKKDQKANPTVQLQKLRKEGKGDPKIPMGDRVYVWCLYIDASEVDTEKEDDKLMGIDVDTQKKGVYVNKNWVVGKSLDYISEQLRIRNNNNQTTNVSEKLNIFKFEKEPILVANNQKGKFKNGDLLYLVRGTI